MENVTLKTILEQHTLWLNSNKKEGKRADLTCANLYGAYLIGANLTGADLRYANLIRSILIDTDLTGANLTGAKLYGAYLIGANLTGAILTNTTLAGADLTHTILDEKEQCRKGVVLTESMIGYKKSNEGKIITLEMPIGAKVFSINNNKRRTNKAKVIDMQGETEFSSMHDNSFKYHVGDEIEIKDFDERYNVECSTGIHFFLTREEAENFKY
jgi:co-chaperonin GroES (HSP10)